MLGIILTYFSFPEILSYQLSNFKKYVKTNYTVFVIDDSPSGLAELKQEGVRYFKHDNSGVTAPSARHQNAVNFGLKKAQEAGCNTFLVFDNDMIFLTEFNLPSGSWYLPQFRGKLEYSWLNLIYLEKIHRFDFKNCSVTGERSDSGGNYIGKNKIVSICDHGKVNIENGFMTSYLSEYNELCKKYNIPVWYDILDVNGCIVFHFCALSNWKKWGEEFQINKKRLILKYLAREAGPDKREVSDLSVNMNVSN